MTPEMRRFVEAVRDDAAERDNPISTDEGRRRSAVQLRRAAAALLAADAGREESQWRYCVSCGGGVDRPCTCKVNPADAGAAGEAMPDNYTRRFTEAEREEAKAIIGAQSPAPARRDEELDDLLDEFEEARRMATTVGPNDNEYLHYEGKTAKLRREIHAHVRRRVAEAEGVTVGTAVLRHQQKWRLIKVSNAVLTDPDWFTDSDGVPVRLVRAPRGGRV